MGSDEFDRIIRMPRPSAGMQGLFDAVERLREVERIQEQARSSSALDAVAEAVRGSAQLKAMLDSVRPADALQRMMEDVRRSTDLRIQMDEIAGVGEMQRHLAALSSGSDFAELVRRAQMPMGLATRELMREATAAARALEGSRAGVERILEALAREPNLIGEFEFDSDGDARPEDKAAGRLVLLPEEVRERLERVEFFPLQVLEKIRKHPDSMRQLSPREFEEMTAELLAGLGFEDVNLTPPSGDGGRDIVATMRINGIALLFAFECKRFSKEHKVQLETLRALLGTIVHAHSRANIGVLVTTSTFTAGARNLILSETWLDGKDFDDLVGWLQEYQRHS